MKGTFDLKKWMYGTLAVFVFISLFEYPVRHWILAPMHPEIPSAAPESTMLLRIAIYLGRLIFSAVFAFVFTKGYEGKSGIGEGLRFGLWIGLLVYLPAFIPNIVGGISPADQLIVRTLLSLVESVLSGTVLSLVYRPNASARA